MGRPEPCVLYAHTFVHPHLDEYVDEVLFSEPVVITACEFLEQNASSLCPAVKLMGATSPPSFALEVFIHCEGETRFRRLCLPFLYSHSSSNVLEVEALVTNHLVVRGSYRSLSMVIYGNTAEDLGQFNIEVDIDSSLTETVSAVEGNMEDLPPAFRPTNFSVEELKAPLKILSHLAVPLDVPLELRQFLQLVFKILDSHDQAAADDVLSSLLSVASTYATPCLSYTTLGPGQQGNDRLISDGDSHHILTERKKLSDIYIRLQNQSVDPSPESSAESMFLESETGVPTSKDLVDTLQQHFDLCTSAGNVGYLHLSQNKNTILWLSLACLLCSARESCFHFVNHGGLKQLQYAFAHQNSSSTALTLLLLGVVEQATRHSFGCEGFLGWWPREDESIPSGISDGYNQLLKLLLENNRHDVASLATYILHRIRSYEVACRYEGAVLSILGAITGVGGVTHFTLDMLTSAKLQLKKLLKMIKLSGPIDDPSPVAAASRSIVLGDAGPLSYQATRGLINLSSCSFSNWDIDSHLLSLLKERGFLPLSAALLSSPICRSEKGHAVDLLVDVVSHIEAIILSLLLCRSGLNFLLHDPEVSSTVIRALGGVEDVQKEDPISLRYASVLISRGFFCHPKEVGMIIQMHTRALIAVDSLSKLTPNTEEFLWVLWDLCRLSRTECGRQALLVLENFPQALEVLIAALHSGREFDPVSLNPGISPLNLAIYHSVAEILEVIVTDSTATSLMSWIDHAKELHTALYSSSPGSNKKDAPARLLEWIDGGVVYHKNGAIGLLRYAAVLASGGDAHMAANSVLASDMIDVDNVVGDFSSISDGSVIDNLIGKRITEKDFPGGVLRDSSIAQLTTAFRILAFISDNSVLATALYDEGAVMVIHAVLINCKLMFERSSNIYDYLVDESAERNSTSDLLIERNREKNLVDLLIPSLVLLINLLQKLQEAKEQHRNTKLMNALLLLHREVSPKLAACASELTHSCPESLLGFGAVCHLLASALACWPLYSWTPGLFHFLLESLRANSLLAMGPKETCSLFCLLNDLLPDESIWLWKNETPMLSALRTLAVGTLLGPEREKQVNWYLRPGHPEKLVAQLSPQIAKVGEIILHCAISMSVVIQDIVRVFIIRIACLNVDNASILLKPIVSWIFDRVSGQSTISEVDMYKVHQLLNFLGILVEHPNAKLLVLKEGGFEMFTKVLERCIGAAGSDVKQLPENFNIVKRESTLRSWLIPIFKSIALICDSQASVNYPGVHDKDIPDNFTAEECSIIWSYLFRFCMVLPVGRELVECLSAVKEMGSSTQGQHALLSIITHIQSSTVESCEFQIQHESDARCKVSNASAWKEHPPLLRCWTNLLRSIDLKDVPAAQVAAAVDTLSFGVLSFCMDGKSLNLERVAAIKFLFGVKKEDHLEALIEESRQHMEELMDLLGSEKSSGAASDTLPRFYQVKETANLLLLLLQKSFTEEDATIVSGYRSLFAPPVPLRIHKIADRSVKQIEDHHLDEFEAKFFWECPENLRDRLTQTSVPGKRKISSVDGPNKHARGDNLVSEATAQSTFSRGLAPVTTPSGPTRRDTFRQRKPNTSRPPSMHVDDYVARERNADGTNSSNVIAVPRIGPTSGRPPSIHVDEFMARQKDRQNVVGMAVSDATAQVKTGVAENKIDAEKSSKPQQLKPDLDDDLQGIDIVFDAEESEPDDKLPFPQPDDILQHPAPVVLGQHSPHSVVEETESDANESSQFSRLGTPLASKTDENTMSEFSSRMSASRPDMPLTREPSISSDKKFSEQPDDKSFPIKTPSTIDASAIASSSGFSASSVYVNAPSSSGQFPIDSSTAPKLYSQPNPQPIGTVPIGTGMQGPYGQKFPSSHPPLPPMPPPPTISPVRSQNMDYFVSQSSPFVKSAADVQAQVQSEYGPMIGSSSSSLATSMGLPDMKFGRAPLSSPGGSTRPPPPLPPTPPPFSATSSVNNPTSQSPQYFQPVSNSEPQQNSIAHSIDGGPVNLSASRTTHSSYPLPPLMQPMLFRPGSMPVNPYGSSMVQHTGDNLTSVSQNFPISLPAAHSIPGLTQLQPLQPPQMPRPPPQHLRPSVPVSPQSDPGSSLLHGSLQMPAQSPHVLPQRQVSPAHIYYQTQQQENTSHPLQQQQISQQSMQTPGDGTSQQQDSGMSLQEFFRSPEAIQSLLGDRDKLCQLLEQHPKLMQMLQERLGQL